MVPATVCSVGLCRKVRERAETSSDDGPAQPPQEPVRLHVVVKTWCRIVPPVFMWKLLVWCPTSIPKKVGTLCKRKQKQDAVFTNQLCFETSDLRTCLSFHNFPSVLLMRSNSKYIVSIQRSFVAQSHRWSIVNRLTSKNFWTSSLTQSADVRLQVRPEGSDVERKALEDITVQDRKHVTLWPRLVLWLARGPTSWATQRSAKENRPMSRRRPLTTSHPIRVKRPNRPPWSRWVEKMTFRNFFFSFFF